MHSFLFAFLASLCLWSFSLLPSFLNAPIRTRLLSPMVSLGDQVWVKGLLALAVVEAGIMDPFLALLGDVFEVRSSAAFALAFVLTFDFISGVYASWWRRSEELGRTAKFGEFLESGRIRDSVVKVAEYISVLLLFTVAANVWVVEVGWAKNWAYLVVFFTEVWSTRENFQHIPLRRILARFRSKLGSTSGTSPVPPDLPQPTNQDLQDDAGSKQVQ